MAGNNQPDHIAQDAFLAMFAKTGNVKASCEGLSIARSTVYHWRKADADFEARFCEAEEDALDYLEAAAWKRAVQGTPGALHRHYDRNGRLLSESQEPSKYSDGLLTLLLKARGPEKFADRHQHTGKDGGALFPEEFTINIARPAEEE